MQNNQEIKKVDLKMDMEKINTDSLTKEELVSAKECYSNIIKLQKFNYITAILWSLTIVGIFIFVPIIVVRIIMFNSRISLIQEHGYKEIKSMSTFLTGWVIASLILFTGFIPIVLTIIVWQKASAITNAK